MIRFFGGAVLAIGMGAFFASAPASAEQVPAEPALFVVQDVNRDTVPAGTPAAFWAAFGDSPRNEASREVDGQDVLFVPLILIALGDDMFALISTGASDCGGPCSGFNSVHYLHRMGADYHVTGEWMDVGATGRFGNPAFRWGQSDAIAASPVLYTEGGGTWQGYHCGYASLTELGPDGPVEIANIPIHYSNMGAVETGGTQVEGRISAAEQGRSFTVSYSGTESFTERYVRAEDGLYRLEGQSAVPSC